MRLKLTSLRPYGHAMIERVRMHITQICNQFLLQFFSNIFWFTGYQYKNIICKATIKSGTKSFKFHELQTNLAWRTSRYKWNVFLWLLILASPCKNNINHIYRSFLLRCRKYIDHLMYPETFNFWIRLLIVSRMLIECQIFLYLLQQISFSIISGVASNEKWV